jgi:HAD superfamily hydrolase (TIGR01509 family)
MRESEDSRDFRCHAWGSLRKSGMEKCQVVLFDFDGILVDTEWAIYLAWKKCFSLEDRDLPLSMYTRCIGSDFETWSPKSYLEELTGKDFDWQAMDQERQQEIVHELSDEGLMAGVVECLDVLRGQGIAAGVVSSSSHHWVDGWLEQLGIRSAFSHVTCRGDAPRIKPAPDLWLEAARRFGVAPQQCLAIEDSHNGMISAQAAGMDVWVVPNRVTSCLDFTGAQGQFSSLHEVAGALKGRMGGA